MEKFVIRSETGSNINDKQSYESINVAEDCEIVYENYLFGDDSYFLIKSQKNTHLAAKCTFCHKIINGESTSSGNFIGHLTVSFNVIKNIVFCTVLLLFDLITLASAFHQ